MIVSTEFGGKQSHEIGPGWKAVEVLIRSQLIVVMLLTCIKPKSKSTPG